MKTLQKKIFDLVMIFSTAVATAYLVSNKEYGWAAFGFMTFLMLLSDPHD